MEESSKLREKVIEAIEKMMAVNTEYYLVEIVKREFEEYFGLEPSHVRLLDDAAVARTAIPVEKLPDEKAREYVRAMGARSVVVETLVYEHEGYCKNENAISPVVVSQVAREEDLYCVVHRIKLMEIEG